VQLEQITVRLRRRSPWEALDLGPALLRNWAAPVYRAWFATYWPAGIVILLVMWPWPEYAILVLWWLKPLFDRVLLFVFSRSVFGDECRVRDLLRELPRVLRGPGVLSGLTLRRCSLARSLLLPVWQLEGQTGADARARFRLLSRRCRGPRRLADLLLRQHVDDPAGVAACSLLLALTAGEHGQDRSLWEWFGGDRSTRRRVIWPARWCFMLAETVVEPLYVASGFSLYLNRRSELEGWDIELGSAAAGTAPRGRHRLRTTLAGARPCWFSWCWRVLAAAAATAVLADAAPPASVAATGEAGAARPPSSGAAQVIDAVLAEPVFGQLTGRTGAGAGGSQDSPGRRAWGRLGQGLVQSNGECFAEMLWPNSCAGVLCRFSGLALAATGPGARPPAAGRIGARRVAPAAAGVPVAGVDLRPASLPAEIVAAAAHAALARGASRRGA
jgi:hypothetical protein